MTGVDTQAWVFPEEISLAGPRELASTVRRHNIGAVSLAFSYHQCVRILPRYRVVRPGPPGALWVDVPSARHDVLKPAAPRGDPTEIHAFRTACDHEGVAFRAWLVVLDNEQLARDNPEYASQTLDGTPTMHALCPSQPAARAYAARLVSEVAHRFSPDIIEVEAAMYPRWNGYVSELALTPLSANAKRYGAQCLCSACAAALAEVGVDVVDARVALQAAAGPPFCPHESDADTEMLTLISQARDRGVALLVDEIRAAAPAGLRLRLLGFGSLEDMRLQGLGKTAAEHAGEILIGMGDLRGAPLLESVRSCIAAHPEAIPAIGMNWSPKHSGIDFVRSALNVAECGVTGFSFYNLSLVPEAGLTTFSDTAVALAEHNAKP